jgi:hypothetical protein
MQAFNDDKNHTNGKGILFTFLLWEVFFCKGLNVLTTKIAEAVNSCKFE